MISATAIILTKNEEVNLPECIKSLKGFAKRIVVIDSGSEDRTVEIAHSMGAEVYVHEFVTHAKQFNWALDNIGIDTKWVLRIDADERLTPELICELENLSNKHKDDDVNGVTLEAWLYFMGRKIKYGCPNKRKMMFFKYGYGYIEERNVDEHTLLKSGKAIAAQNKFIHYDFKNLDHWISKLNWYATLEVNDYFENKTQAMANMSDTVIQKTRNKKYGVYYKLPMFLRCWLLFVYNYFFKLGFLDGKEGFIYNYMYHRWYRTLVDAKICERYFHYEKD